MKTKRTSIITLVSVYLFTIGVMLFWFVFRNDISSDIVWYPVYLIIVGALGIVSAIGLWLMKRWGAIMAIVLSVISQIVLAVIGKWTVISFVLVVGVIGVLYSQYSKMK